MQMKTCESLSSPALSIYLKTKMDIHSTDMCTTKQRSKGVGRMGWLSIRIKGAFVSDVHD